METGTMNQQPRETMRVLPRFLQPFLTWLTGVPLPDEKPILHWTPLLAVMLGLFFIVTGVAIGWMALSMTWWLAAPVLLVSWLLTAGGMRRLDVLIVHQSLHNKVTKSRTGNRIVGETITTLLWRTPYDKNKREHMDHHKYLSTSRDVDAVYLKDTRLRQGMSRKQFNRYVMGTLFSPHHHFSFFYSRMKSNLFSKLPLYRLVMSWGYLAFMVYMLDMTELWLQWMLFWFVPVTFFFQNATYLYTLTEHRWKLDNTEAEPNRERLDELTFGRFCGDPVPHTTGSSILESTGLWLLWWLRVLVLHIPYRLYILVGDTVQHDLHHIRPGCDWANSAHIRRDAVQADSKRYNEVWGTLLDHLHSAASVKDA
jgi:fatty acid desaturase